MLQSWKKLTWKTLRKYLWIKANNFSHLITKTKFHIISIVCRGLSSPLLGIPLAWETCKPPFLKLMGHILKGLSICFFFHSNLSPSLDYLLLQGKTNPLLYILTNVHTFLRKRHSEYEYHHQNWCVMNYIIYIFNAGPLHTKILFGVRKKKCFLVAVCFQLCALYVNIRHDPRSEYNQ